MFKRCLILILILLCSIMLYGCIDDDDTDTGKDNPPIDGTIDNSFFDIDSLNYNSDYNNSENPDQKGFIKYDVLDFNRIKFNVKYNKSPRFEIYYNDNLIKTIEKSPYGTVFPSYTFKNTGVYTIKVLVYPGSGNNLQGEFEVNVKAGGYPDEVVTEITDLEGNPVDEIFAGQQYLLNAKVYSDGEFLPQDTVLFTSQWANGETGQRTRQITIPNQKKDTEIYYGFYYQCFLNDYTQNEQVNLKVNIKNNYQGIQIDYGPYLNKKDVTLDITELYLATPPMFSPLSSETANVPKGSFNTNVKTNFIQYVSAHHKFSNGDIEQIPVNYGNKNVFYSLVAFIRYDDEKEYHRYRQGIYNFDTQNNNYINNNTIYQFHPKKNVAEIYFAYCDKEDYQGGSRYVYEEINNSRFNITLRKNAPENISIDFISGSEKTKEEITDFVSFDRRNVVDNAVEVMVAVENGVNSHDLYRKQYFKINVVMDEDAKARDYTITTEPFGYLNYNYKENYFNPLKEGEAFINIKPVACNYVYTLKVIIVNPTIEFELITKSKKAYKEIPNAFIGSFDIMPYLRIKEYYYNNTSKTNIELNEHQTIRFFDSNNKEKKLSDFVYRDEEYQKINILCFDEKLKMMTQKGVTISFYILPDVTIEIGDETFKLSEVENQSYLETEITDQDGNKQKIIMYAPDKEMCCGNQIQIEIKDIAGNAVTENFNIQSPDDTSKNTYEIFYIHNKIGSLKLLTIYI